MLDHPTEKTEALQNALEANLQGEVKFDRTSRILYSSDASNFQIEPIGVVVPRHEDEINAVMQIAREYETPIIARGSGSSMAGQTLGTGLILDCSKYLNQIHQVDVEARTASVGPGVILDTLNHILKQDGLQFGPDPASAERATIGGMVGNNATGAHSIRYGLMIDHVLKTEVVLSDGSVAEFENLSNAGFDQAQKSNSLLGAIYTGMAKIRKQYDAEVRENWPGTWRRASGYSLNYLTGYTPGRPPVWYQQQSYPPTAGLNLAPLMVGSEGSLAILRKVTLNLVAEPAAKALAILPFESIAEAADETPGLLATLPDAIELIPNSIFERAQAIPAYARKMGFLEGDPAAILVVEYSGKTPHEANQKARALKGAMVLSNPEAQADLWAIRKVGLGLLMSIPGDTKPITFIEDVAVPVESLGDYVRKVTRVLADHQTYGEWYAHASAGCLHLRPMINLKTAQGVQQMRDIAEAVIDITLQLRGSISGEHGDGLSHTEFNERMFGSRLMQAFREVKTAFDPDGLLNPGKVIPAEDGFGGEGSLTCNLRYGPSYHVIEPVTIMAHRREGGFSAAVEACTGVGVCRQENGLMCPSYQVTRDEMHTTRGRANALRAALSGSLPEGSLTSEQMYQVLDLCLECKGCKAECPTAVDMARIKAEFLHLYQGDHGVPLRSRLFAGINRAAAFAQPFAGILAGLSALEPVRWFQQAALGIARQRIVPALAKESFNSWYMKYGSGKNNKRARVILFVDTYTQYMQPEIGQAAIQVLDHLGYFVDIVEEQVCCGRPMISKGLLDEARQQAATNIEVLGREAEKGIPIIGLEPSCLLTLRDEYLEFFPDNRRAHALAHRSLLLEEFLMQPEPNGKRPIDRWTAEAPGLSAHLHNHCYTKALVGSGPLMQALGATGIQTVEIPSSCCGMAGSFGYEGEHYDLSQQIAEVVLLPAVREADAEGDAILAPGYSCRTQIRDGTGITALHPVQLLASRLTDKPVQALQE
jgi:FAD/FMN-containing dehydrogenase/Fe-S oxidoreductase